MTTALATVRRAAAAVVRPVGTALVGVLPGTVVHRLAAWSFAARREQRMLFLDELVDPARPAVDVGAWWGPWTFWLARRCPEVWSFEPNPQLAAVLRTAARSNVRVEPVALSDTDGVTTLFVPPRLGDDAQATVEGQHRLATAVPVDVSTRTLDSYGLDDVGFVKIDVEAHEPAMLRGSIETLRRHRPVVLIEIEQRFHAEPIGDIFEVFADLGYSGWVRREREWQPIESFSVDDDQRAYENTPKSTRYLNNFVFTPNASPPGARSRR